MVESTAERRRVLSGIQPSGQLHLGNYFAMMKRMIEFQAHNELFCFIVNYHALTTVQDGKTLRQGTVDAAMDFLALGLDPEQSIFWVQSDVPEVTELTWILSCVTSMGLLERCHSYKDKIARGLIPTHGLFAYPVLMAADILLYQAHLIPVGKDQKQHVEVTRDIAERFNNVFGDTFVLPEPAIDPDVAVVPGLDGQKMSKSYGNTIEIFSDEKVLRKKVMGIVTDPTPVEAPKDPDKCTVFALYRLFATPDELADLDRRYRAGGMGYAVAKEMLFEKIRTYFAPYRQRRLELAAQRDAVEQLLARGAEKARAIARPTLRKARRKTGLEYVRS
ncbi:MAG TPA: tryptophan--tRNA ligase [Acidobacteriota bacterium]|nr:tryptophan--tRNA ligase [Acidobacteriota bacterium]HQM62834.1 tryptophan--tRNA ligase [Acidobacteriota bacterium]